MQAWEGHGVVATGRQMLGETDPVSSDRLLLLLQVTPGIDSDSQCVLSIGSRAM